MSDVPANTKRGQRSTRSMPNWKSEITDLVDDFFRLTLKYQEVRPSSTGFVYDARMEEHYCLWDAAYPECPARTLRSFERCVHYGLVERCQRIEAVACDAKEALRVHSPAHVDLWRSTENMDVQQMMELAKKHDSVFLNKATYNAALLSLGSTIDVVRAVIENKVRNAMAVVRPPGHHAMENEANGYCFFNNVAVAAKHAIDEYGMKRVLIVDWDVHHGQATQQAFYKDERVLYISIHRYENGWFWPNLEESNYSYIGEGSGKGFNVNVPLNKTGMKNGDYLAVFQQLIMPIAHEYNPELILVSAGYDAAIGCIEGHMEITPAGYAHFTHMLMSLAEGKVVVVLEGGYCLESLSEGVALTLRALLGDPCPAFVEPIEPPSESIRETILNCIYVLRPYWKSIRYQHTVAQDGRSELVTPDSRGPAQFKTSANRPVEFAIKDCYPVHAPELEQLYARKIAHLIASTSLTVPSHRTSLVYDERMKNHRNAIEPNHPEKPERIQSIYEKLLEYGLVNKCKVVQAREASVDELALVHSRTYIDEIRCYGSCRPRDLKSMQEKYNSIYLHPESWSSAILSAGSLLSVVDAVLLGESVNGAAIIRPPGHHAEVGTACGFCFFNNVAVAARYAQRKYGVKRVLIVDWDVHHGNGIQHIFEDDDSVLYVSLHRFDYGSFFPASEDGNYDKVGVGKGAGYNVNIPWNKSSMGDPEYIAAFQQIVMPIAYEFAPELVLISAGFDAAKGDMLGGYKVTPAGYAYMTHMLSGLACGRVIVALEGGYNLAAISEAFATCVHVLLGGTCPQFRFFEPKESAVETIKKVLDVHQKYWHSLRYRVNFAATQHAAVARKLCAEADSFGMSSPTTVLSSEGAASMDDLAELLQATSLDSSSASRQPDAASRHDIAVSAASPDSKTQWHSGKPTAEAAASISSDCYATEQEPGAAAAMSGSCSDSTHPLETGVPPSELTGSAQPCQSGGVARGDEADEQPLLGACGGQEELPPPQMFAVVPLPWCEHLDGSVKPLPARGLDASRPCDKCDSALENWLCLQCYTVLCSRYVNGHMVQHCTNSDAHNIVLSYSDLSTWCYACEAYVDNPMLASVKEAASSSKFG